MEKLKKKETEALGYRQILRYTSLFGGVQGIAMLVNVVRVKIVAMLVGPSGVGLINVFNTSMNLISSTANLGIPFSAVKSIAQLPKESRTHLEEKVNEIRALALAVALVGMFACIALSPLLSSAFFGRLDAWWQFVLLSPAVACLVVAGCELAVLKGMRELRKVAYSSLIGAPFVLISMVSCLYFWGVSGIVPGLLLSVVLSTIVPVAYSFKICPYHFVGMSMQMLKNHSSMLKIGMAYLVAAIVGQGVEFASTAFISHVGTIASVGLYSAGCTLVVRYTSLVFTALDNDYFSRLSASSNDEKLMSVVANKQSAVMLSLVAPLLLLMVMFAPQIIRILYAESFAEIGDMVRISVFYVFFRAMFLPVAYYPLAKGDAKVYMVMEIVSYALQLILVLLGYSYMGLIGAGCGLSVAALMEMGATIHFYGRHYGFKLSRKTILLFTLQMGTLVAAMTTYGETIWKNIVLCVVLLIVSLGVSYMIVRHRKR